MTVVGTIELIAKINTSDYKKGEKEINGTNDQLEKNTDRTSNNMSSAFSKVAKVGMAAMVAAATAVGVAITRNIGNAVQRVDTLNAFPRVLEAMGVSASDATSSTKALAKSLDGLPTSLQDAAAGTQQFVAAGLSAPKATKAFLALNNALLAGGADAADTKIAMDGLVRGISAGQLPASTLIATLNRMPTVFTALQKTTGKTRDELVKLYESDPQKLIDDMIRLNEEGGGGLASLEKQARVATAGIGTGFDNMNTAITRGIAEIIYAIGPANISDAVSAFGESIEGGLKFIATNVPKLMTDISEALNNAQSKISSGNYKDLGESFGEAIAKAINKAIGAITVGIDWGKLGLEVGKNAILFVLGFVTGILNTDVESIFKFVTDNWVEILLGLLAIALAPTKLISPLTKIISKIPFIGPLTTSLINGIRSLLPKAREAFGYIFTNISKGVGGWLKSIDMVVRTIGNILLAPFRLVDDTIAYYINNIPLGVANLLNSIKTLGANFLSWSKTLFSSVVNIIKVVFQPITEFFKGIWAGIQNTFSGAGEWFYGIWLGVKDMVGVAFLQVGLFFIKVWDDIVRIFNGVGRWFGDKFTDALNNIKNIFGGLANWFSGLWKSIVSLFGNVGTAIGNAIGSTFKDVINSVIRGSVNIVNGFIDSINGIVSTINKIPNVKLSKIGRLPIPQLAEGGIVSSATLALIGEGSEPEAVIPLSKLDAMLAKNIQEPTPSGDTINININLSGVLATSKQEQRNLAEMLAKRIEEVQRAKGRTVRSGIT